jgi:hypothetical protein
MAETATMESPAVESPAVEAAAKPAADSGAKPATHSGAKPAANSGAEAYSDAKTRRVRYLLVDRKLADGVLGLLHPRCHLAGLELRNTQLLKIILQISHVIFLR